MWLVVKPLRESGVEFAILDVLVVGGKWSIGELIVVAVYEVEVVLEVLFSSGGVPSGGFVVGVVVGVVEGHCHVVVVVGVGRELDRGWGIPRLFDL